MPGKLTAEEISFLLDALDYSKQAFERTTYPSLEMKHARLLVVERLQEKLSGMRSTLR